MLDNKILMAVPKGRILKQLLKVFSDINLVPEEEFFNDKTRKMVFATNISGLSLIKVRSFDIANFVKLGACDVGVCGSDVMDEFESDDIYNLLDLKIGKCKLCLAVENEYDYDLSKLSHARVVTKYVNSTAKFFAHRGVQAEIIKLNGAVEIATKLGLCDFVVDLVDTGDTMRENGMKVTQVISEVSSRLIANRSAMKIKNRDINKINSLFNV